MGTVDPKHCSSRPFNRGNFITLRFPVILFEINHFFRLDDCSPWCTQSFLRYWTILKFWNVEVAPFLNMYSGQHSPTPFKQPIVIIFILFSVDVMVRQTSRCAFHSPRVLKVRPQTGGRKSNCTEGYICTDNFGLSRWHADGCLFLTESSEREISVWAN